MLTKNVATAVKHGNMFGKCHDAIGECNKSPKIVEHILDMSGKHKTTQPDTANETQPEATN